MYTIAITGGIGAGKSVVSEILRVMGYSVYDSDSEAKLLMDSSAEIRHAIAGRISPDVIRADGSIDRTHLSGIVFNDKDALACLNSIVHSAVRSHFDNWRKTRCEKGLVFIETAILYESHIDAMVDEVWEVTAPTEVRINRVIKRSGLTPAQIRQRITAQQFRPRHPHHRVHLIENSPSTPLLPQIITLCRASIMVAHPPTPRTTGRNTHNVRTDISPE